MGDESPARPHPHHHLSSLVVRPTDSGGGGGGGLGGGSDYEPGEVRRDPPPYSRSDRYKKDSSGHMMRAADSVSPLHHRKVDDRYRPDFDNSIEPHVMHARSISPYQHRKVDDRYRPDFDSSRSPHVMHESSVSPLRQRKLDDRYRSDFNNSISPHAMRESSVSPLRQRKLDDRYKSDYDNSSRLNATHAASVSPLRQRKLDDRYKSDFDNSSRLNAMHAASVSPLRQRKLDDRYKSDFDNSSRLNAMHAASVSPLRHRKMDSHHKSDFDNLSRLNAMHAASVSPFRHRKMDSHHRSDFAYSSGLRGRGFGSGRDSGRFRDFSPPYGRGRGGGRPFGRDFAIQRFDRRPFRNDVMLRNVPNVAPREGDWMCPDPLCNNLNFARRDHCNKCHKSRFGLLRSPRRNYLDPPHFSGPPLDCSPVRGAIDGYRSPPHGDWGRDGPRDFRAGPFIRPGGRIPDQHMRRERQDYPEDDYRVRERLDRPVLSDWGHRDNGKDSFNGRRGYEVRNGRRPISPSPPLPPPVGSRDRWARDVRERSRSPMMGGPVNGRRGSFMSRGRGPQRSIARDRFDDRPY